MQVKELMNEITPLTFIDEYLNIIGVEDVETFRKPKMTTMENTNNYLYIDETLKLFKSVVFKKKANVFILNDCDNDGSLGATLIYLFLIKLGYPKHLIKVGFHKKKTHGVTEDIYNEIGRNSLVIIPDANCRTEFGKRLTEEKNCRIISLDHHDVEKQEYSLGINNQFGGVKNTSASGTLVTFHFIRHYINFIEDKNERAKLTTWTFGLTDLVMVGNMSDVMSTKSAPYENRYMNELGIININNGFLKYMCEQLLKEPFTITDILWNITPLINATHRSDNQELKRKIFECFCGIDTDYETCLKELKSQKGKQDYQVKKLKEDIEIIHNGKIIIATSPKTPYTGLVANKLLSEHRKPIVLVSDKNGFYSGSVRSDVDLKDILNDSKLFGFAEGHSNVFGIGFKKDNLTKIKKFSETLDIENKKSIDVCKSYAPQEIPKELFGMSDEYINYWVTDVPSPVFHIRDIVINTKDIQYLNKYKTTIKFRVGDVSFIRSYCSRVWREENGLNEPNTNLHIEVVGELQLDDLGFKTVKIRNIEIEREVEKEESWEDLF